MSTLLAILIQAMTLVVSDRPHLSVPAKADWYYEDGRLLQTNTTDVFPESGQRVHAVGLGIDRWFQVFTPAEYAEQPLDMEVQAECASTPVLVKGATLGDTVAFSYTNLIWDGEEWVEKARDTVIDYRADGVYALEPLLTPTTVILSDRTGKRTETVVNDIRAYAYHIVTRTTTRALTNGLTNERERPTKVDVLSGSAPLEVLFRANPTPAAKLCEWTISSSTAKIATRTDADHRYTFMDKDTYTIHLCVTGACDSLTEDVTVTTAESKLMVPNVFTPNGDGINDEFRVLYESLREFHIWVFNRWGKQVYRSDNPDAGWNGYIGSLPAPEGAYFYVIRAIGNDAPKNASFGTKASYDKKKQNNDESVLGIYRLSGDINLIRGNN